MSLYGAYRPFLWVPSGLEPGGIPSWKANLARHTLYGHPQPPWQRFREWRNAGCALSESSANHRAPFKHWRPSSNLPGTYWLLRNVLCLCHMSRSRVNNISSSHLLIRMLAPAYQLSVRDQTVSAYQLSALDHSQVIGDQTFYFLFERLSETLFIGQPLQRLSSAASERPHKNHRTFCDDNFHSCLRPGPGQRPKL